MQHKWHKEIKAFADGAEVCIFKEQKLTDVTTNTTKTKEIN